jgi:site-specific DNA-methyltransferase (cytosine-N4-specific)
MSIKLLHGDCRSILPTLEANSVHCVVTSPPYYALRSYLPDGHADKHREIGSERTPDEYLATMVAVFREVKRVLRPDGVCWVNMGDSYTSGNSGQRKRDVGAGNEWLSSMDQPSSRANRGHRPMANGCSVGMKPKDLLMMPARLAIELQRDGWYLRSMLPWLKRSAMPESVTDRPASAVEYVFLLTKSSRYFWDQEACKRSSATNDPRRPYTSQGAKDMDGRAEWKSGQRRDGDDFSGRNMRNSDLFYDSLEDAPEPAPRMRRVKIPGGWDTGDGAHGTVHRNGRTSAEYQEQLAPIADRGPSPEPLGLICDADGSPLALDVNPAAFSAAHFATFPAKLVEPLIRAGTSERGCCSAMVKKLRLRPDLTEAERARVYARLGERAIA